MALKISSRVVAEEFVEGMDLRVVVIDYQVVAASLRIPARIVGTGRHSIRQLIEKRNRRTLAATGGESKIPIDSETERCIVDSGYNWDSKLPENFELQVRKTANLHSGGTMIDVTEKLHPKLAQAAEASARALEIPVVGLDLLVRSVEEESYVVIEANERPGLANHEPQPTAEKFIDLLFPQTRL
jgi:D-alanine-D-alanine ligase-like ATP-grasp enzyme